MYTSGTLEANWWEERVQSSSGTNVGLRVQDRAHHEPPPPMVARERDPEDPGDHDKLKSEVSALKDVVADHDYKSFEVGQKIDAKQDQNERAI